MRLTILACLLVLASPAAAVTNENGETLITQAAALAGNVTPGDAPGFPVTISVPGVYRLASGLTVTSFAHGIDVTAAEVTIDLGGNRIIGSGVGANGINVRQRAATIKNGTIRAFSQDGVRTIGANLKVEGLRLANNGRFGIFADTVEGTQFPRNMRVLFSEVVDSANSGIVCAYSCNIASSLIQGNGGFGVSIVEGEGMLLDSEVFSNGPGVSGNFAGAHNFIRDNAGGNVRDLLFRLDPNVCGTSTC